MIWRLLESLTQDLRYSFRGLRKSPGFATVAILSLALGIGANTTIFSVLNAVLLRLLPVPNPEQLVLVATSNQSFSYPVYRHLRDHAQSLQGLIAFRTLPMSLSVNGATERITGAIVSGNYFSILGVRVSIGTAIQVEDDRTPDSGGPRGPAGRSGCA